MEYSLIIPTRNRPETCLRAVWSALVSFSQIRKNYEVIVAVDGSPDNVTSLRSNLSGVESVRIVPAGNVNNGSVTRNAGIAEATGAWIMFLDDDDEMDSNRANVLDKFLEEYHCTHGVVPDVVLSPVTLVFPNGEKRKSNHCKKFDFDVNVANFGQWQINGVCVNACLAKRIKFDERLLKWQDTKFVFDITHKKSVAILPVSAALWNQSSPGSVMYNHDPIGIQRDIASFILLYWDLKTKNLCTLRGHFLYASRLILILLRSIRTLGLPKTMTLVRRVMSTLRCGNRTRRDT